MACKTVRGVFALVQNSDNCKANGFGCGQQPQIYDILGVSQNTEGWLTNRRL